MKYEFRWNEWNAEHIAEHGISREEAEAIIQNARSPYPREVQQGKYLVRGQTSGGLFLQAAFVVDPEGAIYVIHARPLTDADKRRYRRSLK
jgi:uncharacterized protein